MKADDKSHQQYMALRRASDLIGAAAHLTDEAAALVRNVKVSIGSAEIASALIVAESHLIGSDLAFASTYVQKARTALVRERRPPSREGI